MTHYKKIKVFIAATLLSFSVMGCSGSEEPAAESSASEEKVEFIPTVIGTYEAESGEFTGNVSVSYDETGASGGSFVSGFKNDEDSCLLHVEITENGFYDLYFSTRASDRKENYVRVDGNSLGTVVTSEKKFTESAIKRVYLEQGSHTVAVSKYWGWIDLDYLKITTSEPIEQSFYQVSAELVNQNATDNTKRLMSYLADQYGTNILSGQFCDTGMNGKEFYLIRKATGKTPAVLGLDFIEYTPSRVANGSSSRATDLAIQFWKNGGIVTFCWHWNAPEKYLTGNWYSGFYSDSTNIDLAKIMNGKDEEGYELLMRDIDAIAKQLLILQDAGVPVLWRPLHEASGGWFWWGDSGAEAYIQLYRLLYDKLTNEYQLNNLIWVWNGQNKDWYPGDEYVDIIGEDIYPGEKVYTSQVNKYLEASAYTDRKKMVVLSENGCLFDPALAVRDGAMWGFWCTWGGEFVAKPSAIYAYSEQYTEESALIQFYENEAVITLDEIPDLTQYPIREELQK